MEEISLFLERIGHSMKNHGLKLVLAESMTAGALAARICKGPPAGDYFFGSIVCYSDEMKQSALGVEPALIETYGGVSAEVTAALVRGLQNRFPLIDLFVSVTGFAFDCPATSKENPVGTVYIHIHMNRVNYTQKHIFEGDEAEIVNQAIFRILQLIDEITVNLIERID